MSKILLSLVFLFGLGQNNAKAAPTPPTTEIKIGYVDVQKAIQGTDAGKKAKKDLEKEFNDKKTELQEKEKDLKKMTEDFEKKSAVLSDEVKQKKQAEIQEEMLKYRDYVGKSQLAIQERERNLTAPILEKIRAIIGDIGQKESYTVILEKAENSVLWAPKNIDLTDRVVAEFDKKK